jgi:membrane-bound lytic murein transglycosylase D
MNKDQRTQKDLEELPLLVVKMEKGEAAHESYTFDKSFCIGRGVSCDIQVLDQSVSRKHCDVYFEEGRWWIRDLFSSNGLYVNGEKVRSIPLASDMQVEIGRGGPILSFSYEGAVPNETVQKKSISTSQFEQKYFSDSPGREVGVYTMKVRKAFEHALKRKRRKYIGIIYLVVFLFLVAGGFAVFQQIRIQKQKGLAVELFYAMKSLELDIAQLKKRLLTSGSDEDQSAVESAQSSLSDLSSKYEESLQSSGLYRKKWSEEERLILNVARIFGECELTLPDVFVQEVTKYIKRWQSTNRFRDAILRAKEKNIINPISDIMLSQDLPPHFFYLALQESDFVPEKVGPQTNYGFAKGMWQFIPETARAYGLKLGPLVQYRRHDPRDERHDFEKSTHAAANYIKDIYETEAQASGLLVMASYNWGETRIKKLIREMPENPQERNFWLLLENYYDRIPRETYNYVFYIFSAAVIGENPGLFGFDFANPLAEVESQLGR